MTKDRATARHNAGTAAYRSGDYARAKRELDRAQTLFRAQYGPDDPLTLQALSDLGASQGALGDHTASRSTHMTVLAARRRLLGNQHQDVGASLHNLAIACERLGEHVEAKAHFVEAIAIWRTALDEVHPMIAKALVALSALCRKCHDAQAAIAYARQALATHEAIFPPDFAAISAGLDELAQAQALAGDEPAAQLSWHQALFVARLNAADTALISLRIGLSRRRQGDIAGAAESFAAAVAADANSTLARHHLAAALTRLDRAEEARPHLAAALKKQRIFTQAGPPDAPRVLILASATEGNIPLDHLLPEQDFTRIWWFIDHAPDPRRETLPPHDVVFNALGDPDMTEAFDVKLAAFLDVNGKPLLNHPACVARTRRDRLADLLGDLDGLVVPRVCRISGTPSRAQIMRAAEDAGVLPPLLLRPVGAHGGVGVLRIDNWDAFDPPQAPAWYATSFHECRAADGHTRKYRVIFVNRVPYAYHLAISSVWLVHYFSANMENHAWKLAEEAEFLKNPEAVLGARLFAALHEAGARLDLDYCGMDFGIAAGQILVFEANATMLVHPEHNDGPLAFKNPAVSRIAAALNAGIQQK